MALTLAIVALGWTLPGSPQAGSPPAVIGRRDALLGLGALSAAVVGPAPAFAQRSKLIPKSSAAATASFKEYKLSDPKVKSATAPSRRAICHPTAMRPIVQSAIVSRRPCHPLTPNGARAAAHSISRVRRAKRSRRRRRRGRSWRRVAPSASRTTSSGWGSRRTARSERFVFGRAGADSAVGMPDRASVAPFDALTVGFEHLFVLRRCARAFRRLRGLARVPSTTATGWSCA
eukprot:6656256-Prymnesium_polylepis.1